jgi:hypothetical protein
MGPATDVIRISDLAVERAFNALNSTDRKEREKAVTVLDGIARTAPPDEYWKIATRLASYVRNNAPWKPLDQRTGPKHKVGGISKDIHDSLRVIGLKDKTRERVLDLVRIRIPSVNLTHSHFEYAVMWGSDMQHVNFSNAHLNGADMGGINLDAAHLEGADLTEACLWPSDLEEPRRPSLLRKAIVTKATLKRAKLWLAELEGADFTGADLSETQFLSANLENAILVRTRLVRTEFTGANLYRTDLRHADLTATIGLTRAQVKQAITDKTTTLPDHFR